MQISRPARCYRNCKNKPYHKAHLFFHEISHYSTSLIFIRNFFSWMKPSNKSFSPSIEKKIEKLSPKKRKKNESKKIEKGWRRKIRKRDTKWQFSDFHPSSITKLKNYEFILAFFCRPIIYHKLSFLSMIMLKSDRILKSCSFVMMIMSM